MFLTVPKNKDTKKLFDDPDPQHSFYEKVVDEFEQEHYKYNIAQLHTTPISELTTFLDAFQQYTDQPQILVQRIIKPLLDRARTIESL